MSSKHSYWAAQRLPKPRYLRKRWCHQGRWDPMRSRSDFRAVPWSSWHKISHLQWFFTSKKNNSGLRISSVTWKSIFSIENNLLIRFRHPFGESSLTTQQQPYRIANGTHGWSNEMTRHAAKQLLLAKRKSQHCQIKPLQTLHSTLRDRDFWWRKRWEVLVERCAVSCYAHDRASYDTLTRHTIATTKATVRERTQRRVEADCAIEQNANYATRSTQKQHESQQPSRKASISAVTGQGSHDVEPNQEIYLWSFRKLPRLGDNFFPEYFPTLSLNIPRLVATPGPIALHHLHLSSLTFFWSSTNHFL